MPPVENPEEVKKVRAYVAALQEAIGKIGIRPRVFYRYPFDHISLALVSKAFSLSNALLILLDAGNAEEAYGLSRSIVECALTLRFLTQDRAKLNERTYRYMVFEAKDKEYWMHWALQHASGGEMERKIRDHAKQFDIKDDPSGVRKHWSGKDGFAWKINLEDHPLDNATSTDIVKKATYAVEYHATSSYVHCFSPVVNNLLPREFVPFEVKESSGEFERPSQKTLLTLISYLHNCVVYTLFGMNVDRPASVNQMFSDALASLMPFRKLHS